MKIDIWPHDIEAYKDILRHYLQANFAGDAHNRRLHILAKSHVKKLGKKLSECEWEEQESVTLTDEELVVLSLASAYYLHSTYCSDFHTDSMKRLARALDPHLVNLNP